MVFFAVHITPIDNMTRALLTEVVLYKLHISRTSSSATMSTDDGSEGGYDSSLETHKRKKESGRRLKTNRLSRSANQREVDAVDISAPSLWLHHETVASFTLRREAQNDLQMWEKSARKSRRMDGLLKSLVSQAKSEGKIVGWREEEQVVREATASEVLPWGAWPIRLKNQDGQSFYSLNDAQVNGINPSRHFFLDGDEEDIHDYLLRPSQRFERKISAESPASVVRLLPAEDGTWTEANSRIPLLSPMMTASPGCRASNECEVEGTSDAEVVDANGGGPSLLPAAGDAGGDGASDGTQSERRGGRKRRLDDPDEIARFDAPRRIRLDSSGYNDPGNALGRDEPRPNDDIWQGWTVAEPAKEAVRRVWARARRRVEDACDPRLVSRVPESRTSRNVASHTTSSKRAPSSLGEGDFRETIASSTASGGSSTPNPLISSCLGRECEGLIDAALQVILVERSRELANTSTRSSDVSDRDRPSRSSWEDVLRVMGEWSAKARSDAGAGLGTADGGTRKPSDRGVPSDSALRRGPRKAREALEGRDLNGGTSAASEDQGRGSERSGGDPKAWGAVGRSDGAVVVVSDRLPALPLNDAVLVRSYNRLLLYLHEKKPIVP